MFQNNKKLFLVILVVVLALGGVVAWLVIKQYGSNSTKSEQQTQAVVQIGANGFTPSTLSIKLGTTVVWKNIDAAPHSVASNPYPADNSLPDLRSEQLPPEASYTFTPTAAGTINYHDDLAPTNNGVITVTK